MAEVSVSKTIIIVWILMIFALIILLAGEPDLLDAIQERVRQCSTTP